MAAVSKSRRVETGVRSKVSREEWAAREDLAALYRYVSERGWDDHIFTHITMRVPGEPNCYLVNPLDLTFNEITASSLLKIDDTGKTVLETPYTLNRAAYVIHSAVYKAFDHAACVVHLHTPHGVAVSIQADGLRPLSQHAMILGHIAYHDFEGIATDEDECARLARDMGEAKCMVLRNHGTLTWGELISEVFQLTYNLERACEYQVLAMAGGAKLNLPSDEVVKGTSMTRFRRNTPDSPYSLIAWQAIRRNLDRTQPDYAN